MKFPITLAILLSLPASLAWSEEQASKPSDTTSGEQAQASDKAELVPTGFVIIEETAAVDLKALPLALMDDSLRSFKEKNYGEAMGDLNSMAKLIRSVSRGVKPAEEKVQPLVSRIEKLGSDLKASSIKTEAALKKRLAELAYYKAAYNRSLAQAQFDKRQLKRAGHDLEAAVLALDWAEKYSGKTFTGDTKSSLKHAREVASKLMDGTGWTEADVNSALAQLNSSMDKVGQLVAPSRSRAEDEPSGL